MAEQNSSTITFDGDSTGAVAAITAVDVAAKRAAAGLKTASEAVSSMDGAAVEKTTAKLKSMREAILRNGDAVYAEAEAYGQVEKAIQKIKQKKEKVTLFTNELDYLSTAEAYLKQVQRTQKEIAASESRQIAENMQWNALKLQKVNEVKAVEMAAIKAATEAEKQALVSAQATAAFKVQSLNEQLKSIKAIAIEAEKVAQAEKSASASYKVQSLNDQIKASKSAELQRVKEVQAAELAAVREVDSANKAATAFKVQSLNEQLRGIKTLAIETEKVAQAEKSASTSLHLQGLNDQIKASKAAELQRINEVKAAELAAIREVESAEDRKFKKAEAAQNAYMTRVKNAAVEVQSVGLPASEKSLVYARTFGIPEADAQKQYTYLKDLETQVAKTNSRYNEFGMTARGTSAALRTLPAQFTDIIVSLQGGQAPLTVLLQQGGQIKDSFGGAGNALKVMGQYVMGLINPISIMAVTAGTLALAFFKGAGEAEAYNRAIITTGNAAGTTTSRLSSMAQAVSDATGSTVGSIASAMTALVGAGNIAESQFSRLATTATQFEKVAGVAVSETVKQFAELGKDPVKAIDKLNESHHFLTAEIYSQIKALQDQGDALGAGALAQKAWADALDDRIPKLQDNMGLLEKGWKGVMSAAKSAWDAMLGVGRGSTNAALLSAAQDQYTNAVNNGATDAELKSIEARVEVYKRMIASEGSVAALQADRIKRDEASIALRKEGEKSASKEVKMQIELNRLRVIYNNSNKTEQDTADYAASVKRAVESAKETAKGAGRSTRAKAEIDEAAKGIALYNSLIAKSEGFTANYAEQMLSLSLAAGKGALSIGQVAEAAALINEQQPGAVAAAKALKDASAAADKYIDSLNKSADAVEGQLQKLQDEEEALLLSASANITLAEAIAEVEIARLREAQAIQLSYGNDDAAAAIQREIDARRELAQSINSKDAREAAKKGAEQAAAEWQKTADQINDTLTDALMRGFEDGKGFAENMRDTIVNMFKTLVLRPTISAIMQPVAQGIQGALGLGGGASGTLGTASNLYSGFNALSGGLNTAGAMGGLFASNAAYGAAIGTTSIAAGSQAAMLAAQTGTFGAAGVAATSSAAAGAGAGASSMMATAGPYALAALAIYSLAKSMDDSGTYHSGGTGAYSADKGMKYGATAYSFGMGDSEYRQDANMASGQVAMAVSGIIDTAAGIAGSSAKSFVGTGYADDSSKDGAWGGLMIKLGDQLLTDWGRGGDKWPGREFADGEAGQKQYLDAIALDVRRAIDGIGLPEWASDYLDRLGEGAGLEQLAEALEKIKLTEAAFVTLGDVFTGLSGLSDEAKNALLKVSGGIEALAGVASAYYDNFYTSQEKTARLTGKTAEAFAELGLVMPAINDATRANYRALIDELAAKDLSIEANAKAYAGALSLQGAMNELAPAFDAVGSAAKKLAEEAAKLRLDTAGTIADDAFAALERAVDAQRKIYQVQADAAQDAVTEIQGIFDTLDSSIKQLYGQTDNAQQGRAFIDNAVSVAKTTGYLPDAEELSGAIQSAMNDSTVYASQAEADFSRLSLAGSLTELKDISGVQLTAAEQALKLADDQLTVLENTLDMAQRQLDAANGINTSVLSVAAAMAQLSSAITALAAERINQGLPSSVAGVPSGGTVAVNPVGTTYAGMGEDISTIQDLYSVNLGRIGEAEGIAYWTEQFMADGIISAEEKQKFALAAIPEYLAASGRSFSVGTNYVPQDMIAQIHEGEAIIPKAYNPSAQGVTAGNAKMESLIEGLTKEVQRLQSIVNDGNKSNERIASTLDNVTEGGSNMRTVTA